MLGLAFALSEIGLAVFKRAHDAAANSKDLGSLRLLWTIILLSVAAGYWLAGTATRFELAPRTVFVTAGIACFVAGAGLRWASIFYLGRFFTVNVAIAPDHRLIDTGPYRHVRHPSYTGALLAFLGLALCLCNGATLAAIMVPTTLAFLRRIRIEEDALSIGLGDPYRDYMQRTKRLIPAVY